MSLGLNDIEVRLTTEKDWEALKTIRLESLLDAPDVFAATYTAVEKYSEAEWRARAAHQTQHHYILAFKDAQAIGIIGGIKSLAYDFNLIAMWVNPKFRGNGVAYSLIDVIKKFVISKGHNKIRLSVSPSNTKAVDVYSRHGFVFISEWEAVPLSSGKKNQKMECLV